MKMELIEEIRCGQLAASHTERLFAARKCRVSMLFCNRTIEKRRGNFPDAIFHVNVQFPLNSKICLFIVRSFYCYFRLEYEL